MLFWKYGQKQKVKAIQDLPAPHNVPELRHVLGMMNYLGRFLPNLSGVVSPMSEYLRANVPKNQTFLKYGGNSQKINSAHILRLARL